MEALSGPGIFKVRAARYSKLEHWLWGKFGF